jgi:hypothetical protein
MKRTLAVLTALLMAVVLALALNACGGGGDDDDDGDSLSRRDRNATATARAEDNEEDDQGDQDDQDDQDDQEDEDADATATARAEEDGDDEDDEDSADGGDPDDECEDEPADPPAGWVRFEGGGAEFWLPDTYQGGDVQEDVQVILERLRAQGPDFQALADIIEANPELFVLLAFDTAATDFGTNVNITRQSILSRDTLESQLTQIEAGFPPSFRIRRREIVCRGENRVGRIVIDATVGTEEISELFYMVVEDSTLWTVTYAAGADEYEELSAVFEQSIETLRVEGE